MIKQILSDMKPLRIMLITLAIALIILRPAVGTPMVYHGWDMVPTVFAPVLTPIIFMLILLDSFMSKILMLDKPAEARVGLRRVMRLNLIVGIVLLAYWVPYFNALHIFKQ